MDGGTRVPVPLTREDDGGGKAGLVVSADGPVDIRQDVFAHPHQLGRALGHPVAHGRVALSRPVTDCRVPGTLETQGPDQGLANAEVRVLTHTVKQNNARLDFVITKKYPHIYSKPKLLFSTLSCSLKSLSFLNQTG